MGARLFALACLPACSFTPGQPHQQGSGAADAPPGMAADAMKSGVDAAIDAKVFMDAAPVTGSITVTSTPYGNTSHDVNHTGLSFEVQIPVADTSL